MSIYEALDRRIRSEEVTQSLSVLLLLLSVTLIFSWTSSPLTANDSWFNITAVRRTSLALLALFLALRSSDRAQQEQVAAFITLFFIGLVTVPFELVAFAASYPDASAVLSMVFDLVFPLGIYSLALLGTKLVPRARWLTLLFAPLVLVALVTVDEILGRPIFSPVNIVDAAAWPLVLTWSILSLAGLLVTLLERRSEA